MFHKKWTNWLICLLLCVSGFLGNWFSIELFFDVDFLLGSFFVMLAILMLGQVQGIVVGLCAATCTFFIWNHPWAIIIMTGEAVFVAFSVTRRNGNLIISDMRYWALIGMPLVYFFYHHVMAIQMQSTLLIMLKQAMNGVFASLLATIAFLLIKQVKNSRQQQVNYFQAIFVTMVSLVLLPAMLFLAIGMRLYLAQENAALVEKVSYTSDIAQKRMASWIRENLQTVRTLSTLAGNPDITPIAAIQHHVETLKDASPDFFRMGIIDKFSRSIAYSPLEIDGRSTLGVDFSDRPYIPLMKSKKAPYITDVVMGKFGNPIPIVLLLSPVVVNGEYMGYASGVIDISEITEMLIRQVAQANVNLTLVDGNWKVIASTLADLKTLNPFVRPYTRNDAYRSDESFHWIPDPQAGTSIMQRWRASLLVKTAPVSPDCNWKVIVEAPLLPLVEKISLFSIKGMGLFALVTFIAVVLSHLFSKGFVSVITVLQDVTKSLPERLAEEVSITWPESRIIELDALCHNFSDMAQALTASFHEQKNLNEILEKRVQERTEALDELSQSREQLRILASRLQSAREEERIGIAREIHDVLAQELTRLKLDLVWLQRRLTKAGNGIEKESLLERISEMGLIADTAIGSVQKIATELRPAVLDSLGLCAAIEWQTRDFQKRSGIICRADIPGDEPIIDREAATAIFRILQESLTNVLRHAGATRVDIRLRQEEDHLVFEVQDNGCGIAPEAISNQMSIGVTGMRERALLLGGRFTIQSRPGMGTVIEVHLPLAHKRI